MSAKKLWGGRFAQSTSADVEDYTESVSFDRKFYAQDIAGSKAHARMMAKQGVLTPEEADILCSGLDQVLKEIEDGSFSWLTEREDVHMNIEARLTEIVGPVGGKLHTGRSRNDQVALDFRLFVRDRMAQWEGLLKDLVAVLVAKAEDHTDTLLPGCTHFQPAQPVSLGQHLLAYAWMFRRDYARVQDCLKRVNVCPLGAAALAGTTYPVNPALVADDLGMDATFANSMDAVSDRDFVLEALFISSVVMMHLSRINEELIIWANPLFGFVSLPDQFATGSSIMPQKKNPDVSEIMRGKTGRVYGDLMGLLTVLKGLPMTYNRDLQEDKEPFLDADKTVSVSLSLMAQMMEAMVFNPEPMAKAMSRGFLNATELADYLVGKGMPFRDAHHVTGRAVAAAEAQGKGLDDFSLEELKCFSELVEQDVFEVLSYGTAVKRRTSPGSTGPNSVAAQIKNMKEWLG